MKNLVVVVLGVLCVIEIVLLWWCRLVWCVVLWVMVGSCGGVLLGRFRFYCMILILYGVLGVWLVCVMR